MPKYIVTGYVAITSEVCIAHTVEAETKEEAIESAIDAAVYERGGTVVSDDLDAREIEEGE